MTRRFALALALCVTLGVSSRRSSSCMTRRTTPTRSRVLHELQQQLFELISTTRADRTQCLLLKQQAQAAPFSSRRATGHSPRLGAAHRHGALWADRAVDPVGDHRRVPRWRRHAGDANPATLRRRPHRALGRRPRIQTRYDRTQLRDGTLATR